MKEWMDEVNKVAGVEAVFALRFFRSSDGELTRLGMMCRGKYMNYRIECSASNILDDEKNSMQVFIDSEELFLATVNPIRMCINTKEKHDNIPNHSFNFF